MAKRVLTIIDHRWLDKDTFLATTKEYRDKLGVFHYEVEYHADEKRYVTQKCYEHEVVSLDFRETNLYGNELVKMCRKLCKTDDDHLAEALIAHAH